MPRIQSQMKLREMRLRNYLQHTEERNQVRHSWRLRGLDRWVILRWEGKGTRVLLQKLDKVLDHWHQVSQGKMGKPAAVGKDMSTCSTWQWPHGQWVHSAGKKCCLNSPMGAWLRMARVALAHKVTDSPINRSQPPPLA